MKDLVAELCLDSSQLCDDDLDLSYVFPLSHWFEIPLSNKIFIWIFIFGAELMSSKFILKKSW